MWLAKPFAQFSSLAAAWLARRTRRVSHLFPPRVKLEVETVIRNSNAISDWRGEMVVPRFGRDGRKNALSTDGWIHSIQTCSNIFGGDYNY
ncbi:hypothetical protein CEXT_269661 [Caerostris extrusa]|uniref:Uncharacterized protein n=1 Tax=Caerostris extrusa TaxID=172846 RepID=A0AAV4MVM8_CAEEX|nr:hypothetical protein CEXT_269661 [Caerostris extrusa]